jgi:hyperosmotically inducible periplasmic protein
MRTHQLLLALIVVGAMPACNRTDADANAERAAQQMKTAAAKAGHQLADSWLTTKIQAQYFADDDIKARHINVSTRDGVVTLTGYVEGEPQRELAVQIAKTTDGVRQVNDRLALAAQREGGAIATTGTAPPTAGSAPPAPDPAAGDPLITARVQSKFFVDERVKGTRIDVDTRNGVVTLSGDVADEDERAQALLLARTTEGVQRVEDHLTVAPRPAATAAPPETAAPRVDDAMLTTAIQAKYFVDPAVKASAVDVSVKDGVVLLQGTVADEPARKQALAIAQSTSGVVQVVDRLTVRTKKR